MWSSEKQEISGENKLRGLSERSRTTPPHADFTYLEPLACSVSFSQENICFWDKRKINQSPYKLFSATEGRDKSDVSNSKEKFQVLILEFVTFIYVYIVMIDTLRLYNRI